MKQILITPKLCLGCRSCELACAVEHSLSKELFAAVIKKEQPTARIFVETDGVINLPLQCRHCQDPACVNACMSGALQRKPTTGMVVADQNKCVGCWMCVMACPFGAIAQDPEYKVINKCDRCPDLDQPACTVACPTGAVKFVEVSRFSQERRKQYLTSFAEEE
ncbi:4Fe-4S dicluster domain-containing protein [Metallumcola ferriviriculae]|uniref:4Fe-4S dicluster domain-containing protein n=1 Tax=Metallumcola ferriviriculae TaxID=3039180 RepID=A0AAU0UN07_9FIRM|nr:4Fe-4S dicluster domain-containing protein [Desulfitibacteraceae bacterium MK1]